MRWVVIILIIAVAGGLGWFVASQTPAQKFLLLPVQNWLSGETPDDTIVSEETEPAEMIPEAETPPPSEPEAPPVEEPDSTPPPVELEGDAALAQYRVWISEARALHPYPDSETRMFDVMMCESGGKPSIVNPAGPYTGLFQYATDTWNGDWNTYRDNQITDARSQIFATALAWNLSMQSHWGCYTRAH